MNRQLLAAAAVAIASAAAAQTPPPLTIQQAIAMAVDRSPDIAAARAAQREAAASADLARSAFRPAATVSTTPGYATGLPVAILGSVPAIASVEAHETLYDNFVRSDALSAAAQADARAIDIENATRQTAEAAAQAYARYAADRTIVANARGRIAAMRAELARVAALVTEGRATQLDADRAQLQVDRAENQTAAAGRASDVDEARLRQLTGWSTPGAIPVATATLDVPAGTTDDHLAAAAAHDLEMRSLDRQLSILRQSVSILRRPFQPSIQAQTQYSRLFGRYSRFYREFKTDDFSIGASIVIPIWTGGRRAASIERVNAQLQRLEAQRASRQAAIENAVRAAESDLNAAQGELRIALRAKAIAEESLRIGKLLAQEGRGEPNGVTASEVELTDANDEIARAELHVSAATARILSLRGELNVATR
jgi:outer membrane protein